MPRFKLTVEYDGRNFVGWQRQDNGPSVQAALEDAAAALCGKPVLVEGAGRTDAGVHATGQVAHVDFESVPADRSKAPEATVRDAMNYHLREHAIAVLDAVSVDNDFHARFSAIRRRYCYRIVNRRAPLALDAGRAWQVAVPLDVDAMAGAVDALLGFHDFTSFRSVQCQSRSPEKTLDRLDVVRDGDDIRITAGARSFLHNQVRIIVGSLRLVGEGKWTRKTLADALAARDRAAGGPTAPPDGLYLVEVGYQ